MKLSELTTGQHIAARVEGAAKRTAPIEVIYRGRVPGKSRDTVLVEIATGPDAGKQAIASLGRILGPWDEVRAALRDEAAAQRLAAADDAWPEAERDAVDLLWALFLSGQSLDDPVLWQQRAGLPGSARDFDPDSYQDRHGGWHLSFATQLEAVRGVVRNEVTLIESAIALWELDLGRYESGIRSIVANAAGIAVIRDWIAEARASSDNPELQHLRSLVRATAKLLRDAGRDDEADALDGALDGGIVR